MMRHTLVTVGQVRAPHFRAACDEYLRRLRPYARVEIVSVSGQRIPGSISPAERQGLVSRESDALVRAAPDRAEVLWVSLDERGKQMTSVGLAGFLSETAVGGRSHVVWFIGGPLGLSRSLISDSHLHMSLSALTFPHEMVPVILLEQIYRSCRIQRGEPYHC